MALRSGKKKRARLYRISLCALADLLRGGKRYEIISGFPEDARISGFSVDPLTGQVIVMVESIEYELVHDGMQVAFHDDIVIKDLREI